MRLWNLAGQKGDTVKSVIDWTTDGQKVKDAFKDACREGKSEFDRLTVINSTQGRVKTRRFKTPTEASGKEAPKKRTTTKKAES